jgi:7,8-dihydroneopterin aldolase/epimerase/oxygenase
MMAIVRKTDTAPLHSASADDHGGTYRRVFVRDFEIVVSVGVFEREKRYEQRIIVSADLYVRDNYDGASDRIADVVDYGKVVDGIARLAQSEHVNLIETLAERIAQHCLADHRVDHVRVRIEKPDVLESCPSVGIEIERRRPPAAE